MFDFIPQEYEKLVNIIFLIATALIARHGITYRTEDGEKDFVRLLFGNRQCNMHNRYVSREG